MRRLFPALLLLLLLAPARCWGFGLEHFDCETPGDRWAHASEAFGHIIAATASAIDGQSLGDLGFDNGSLAMSAIGIGMRILGTYEAFYVSPTEALNSLLIPLTCHRIT